MRMLRLLGRPLAEIVPYVCDTLVQQVSTSDGSLTIAPYAGNQTCSWNISLPDGIGSPELYFPVARFSYLELGPSDSITIRDGPKATSPVITVLTAANNSYYSLSVEAITASSLFVTLNAAAGSSGNGFYLYPDSKCEV